MQELKTRNLAFHFDQDIPFDWNPGHPAFGNVINFAAVLAPAFERYFVRATREAMKQVTDPVLSRNLAQFCAQEGTHSKHHRAHMALLVERYPGLRETVDAVDATYDDLFATRSLEFHLAYMAILEGWFPPIAVLVVENREALLGRSDPRIASFVLWHLIEEFEHRTSAHDLYKAIVPTHRPILEHLPTMVRHIADIRAVVLAGFHAHVPVEDNPTRGYVDTLLDGVPLRDRLRFVRQVFASLLPGYDPMSLREPAFATEWFRLEREGRDMTRVFPASAA